VRITVSLFIVVVLIVLMSLLAKYTCRPLTPAYPKLEAVPLSHQSIASAGKLTIRVTTKPQVFKAASPRTIVGFETRLIV